jgi:hypothetical protein
MIDSKKPVEHRKQKRFQAPKGSFVGVGPYFVKVGRLRDLNMDGLAFRYLGNGESLDGAYVDLFLTDGDFYLGKLPIETVSDIEVVKKTSPDSKTLRRCWVKFKKLTPWQRGKLKEFIDTYTLGEA